MNILVDTGAFYALADRSDRHSTKASSFYENRLRTDRFITTDAIIIESWRLIRGKLGWNAAQRFWSGLKRWGIEVIHLEAPEWEIASKILDQYSDQELSLVDATSFAVMERRGVSDAFTFDKDFLLYRYGPRGERSFRCWP